MNDNQLLIFHVDMNFVCYEETYLKKWLKKVADMGYNAILWELEDKVQWESCPDCIWPEAMSKESFQELLAYSKSLGLEPIPLLQTIGHGEYILKHEKYRSLRELDDHHDCYCTLNPEVKTFLKSLISEYLDLFGELRYFHLGGDEAYVFAKCPDCTAYVEEHGKNKLYADHIAALSEEIIARGVRPGIWCDMVLHYPDQVDAIPAEFVIWDWNYWSNDGSTDSTRVWNLGHVHKDTVDETTRKLIPELMDENGDFRPFYTSDMLQRLGYDVVLCSASRSAGDSVFCPAFTTHNLNIIGAARKTKQAGLLGNCVTSWAIRINPYELQELSLMLAPATLASPDADAETLIKQQAEKLTRSDPSPLLPALEKLGRGFHFSQAHSTGIQWNSLKDSLTPPAGYIDTLIEKWKTDPKGWDQLKKNHKQLIDEIKTGIGQLNQFIVDNDAGLEFLEFWSRAAYQQLWQAKIARTIFHEDKNSAIKDILPTIKAEARQYFLRWEKPESATKNADLIFDCLAEYLGE